MYDYSINTGVARTFGTVDYVMFGLTLFISFAIGLYFAIRDRKKESTDNFQLGGRTMGVFPVAMSLLVTFLSALSLLGNSVEIYNYNTMFWYLCAAFLFVMFVSGRIFVPFFYNLRLTSMFEYLELRFNKPIRIFASLMAILQGMVYVSFVLYAPSLALTAVTGFNLWGCIIGLMLLVTAYTAMGGMKAVVWTDTFQAVVIIAGLLAVLIQGSIAVGGFGAAWKVADERGRVVFDIFDPDPKIRHSFWTVVIGGGIFWTSLYSLNQAQIQRAMSLPTLRKSQFSYVINFILLVFVLTISFMIGIVMFAFYADCHPVGFKALISRSDQLLPLFVMDILGNFQGVPGIFVSCVFSGSLSTLSSTFNALSALTIEDFVKPYCCVGISDAKATILSKIAVVVYGLVGIGLVYVVTLVGSLLQASYTFFSVVNGPVCGLFILGMFFPWANKWGAATGCFTAIAMLSWIASGSVVNKIRTPPSSFSYDGCNWNLTTTATPITMVSTTPIDNITTSAVPVEDPSDPFYDMYRLSYLWYTATGILIEVVVGLIVSFITGHTKPEDLDPKLICPFFDRVFPFLPEGILMKLRCGVQPRQQNDYVEDDIEAIKKKLAVHKDVIISESKDTNGYTTTNRTTEVTTF